MLNPRTGKLTQFVVLSLCLGAPLTAVAQDSVSPPPAAEATLDFLPDQNDPTALRCDALADHPTDPHRAGDGVVFEEISLDDALPVCEQAANRQPARPRYQYLYGRVLDSAGRYDDALRQFTLANQAGYALAAYSLGAFYKYGTGVAQDYGEAGRMYFRAGNGGVWDAYAELGTLYAEGTPADYPEAKRWFEHAMSGGSQVGRVYLGELYVDGRGVPADWSMAVSLFLEAEAHGDSDGIYDLGLLYRDGEAGVPKNPTTSYGWFIRAAQKGHVMAMVEVANDLYLGRGVGEDHQAAFDWYLQAAHHGVPVAQRNVATLYDLGDGVTQSEADAAAWYRQAAEQGDTIAMTQLSHHLRWGRGVAQDVRLSWEWLTKAADAGYPAAETELGMFYEDGFGHQQAAHWLGEAAKQGDGLAEVELGKLYQQGFGVDRDLDQARRLFTQAAASADPEVAQTARASLAALNPAPQPNSAAAPTAPALPQRRLPTQPSAAASDRSDTTAKVAIGVGLTVGAILLLDYLMGSDSESSNGSGQSGGTSTTTSSGPFGGSSSSTSTTSSVSRPDPPRPMVGNIFKIRMGEEGRNPGVVGR
jgi:TPR repeat protein